MSSTSSTSIDFPYKTVHLNAEQFRVVTADPYEHQRILASAGSGKTTTITARIAWLIHRYGIPANRIVLLTFSRNAAREMTHRVKSLVGPVSLWSGTFHGLARQILSLYEKNANHGNYFIDELPVRWTQWMRTPKGREWVGKLRYIIVDEFQDINMIQWRLLETMRHYGVRVTIVGDDAQNIYTWRGSSAGYLLDFHSYVKGLKDYQLKMNYRSTEAIVAAANSCMRGIPTLEWKEHMIAHTKGGRRPDVLFFWRLSDECLWVAKTVQELRAESAATTIAILARNNVDLYRIEEVLLQQGLTPRILALDPTDEVIEHGLAGAVGAVGAATPPDLRRVDLTTFHGSKGLEWDVVFNICLTDDQLPSRKRAEDIIGERRLFYVAITRARKRLFLTYHGNERKLSRFVREIGYKLLQFHGLANYALSDIEIGDHTPSLQSLLDCLDGDDWSSLRLAEILPWVSSEQLPFRRKELYPPGEQWRIPDWAEVRDFEAFVRLFMKRCMFQQGILKEPYRDPLIERMIFTIRIFQEDKPFWSQWRNEIEAMVKFFFKDSARMPPAGYADVELYSRQHGFPWSQQDLINATSILAKLRGQLRPLRFDAYSLDEFTICPAHVVAPTEYRADLLRSWRAFQNRGLGWKECLIDIWRLACLEQVAEGRNAGLFRVAGLKDSLAECIPFLENVERAAYTLVQESGGEFTLNAEVAPDGLLPLRADCVLGSTVLQFCGEKRPDLYSWTELSLTAYLCGIEGGTMQPIRSIQLFHPFHGSLLSLDMPGAVVMKRLYKTLLDVWIRKQTTV